MPAPNRNRRSDDYGGGSSAIRTLGAFLLCAVLSFALGFFVLARFWSSKPRAEGDGSEKNRVAAAGDLTPSRHSDDTPVPQRAALPEPKPATRTIAPRIDPEEDVQKPASLDDNKDEKKPPTSSQDDVPDVSEAPKKSDETRKPTETTPTDPPPTEEVKPKRHKKVVTPDETQPSKAPDEERTPPESTDDVNDVHAPRHKRMVVTPKANTETAAVPGGLFRVQIGVYSTREKAEEQAKSASDKGFETTIHTVTNGDRTLYRVQHSAHRTRVGAETEKQRLVDAGFDAYIANP